MRLQYRGEKKFLLVLVQVCWLLSVSLPLILCDEQVLEQQRCPETVGCDDQFSNRRAICRRGILGRARNLCIGPLRDAINFLRVRDSCGCCPLDEQPERPDYCSRFSPAPSSAPSLVPSVAPTSCSTTATTIYFAFEEGNQVYQASVMPAEGEIPQLVVGPAVPDNLDGPTGFDIDFENELIYINSRDDRATYVQPLSGLRTPTKIPGSDAVFQEHLAIKLDLERDRYFFTTRGFDGLYVHLTNGTGLPMQLANNTLSNLNGMDYDPIADTVYVGGEGSEEIWAYRPVEENGVLVGVGNALYTSVDGVRSVYGISLDLSRQTMFWAQRDGTVDGTGKIFSANITGAGPTTELYTASAEAFPVDLEVFGDQLFWTERDEGTRAASVYSACISDDGSILTSVRRLYESLPESITGIKVV